MHIHSHPCDAACREGMTWLPWLSSLKLLCWLARHLIEWCYTWNHDLPFLPRMADKCVDHICFKKEGSWIVLFPCGEENFAFHRSEHSLFLLEKKTSWWSYVFKWGCEAPLSCLDTGHLRAENLMKGRILWYPSQSKLMGNKRTNLLILDVYIETCWVFLKP